MLLHVFLIVLAIKSTRCGAEKSSTEINPLFLSDFISAGKIDEARKRSEVRHSSFLNKSSFSGYLTVNKAFNSNMFFWFFPSETKYEEAPVVLWLQGGPGDSTFISLFYENGPFTLTSDLTLVPNQHSWTKEVSMLYVDNPVGAGFSFTEGGYCKNQTQIGEEVYEALRQFFMIFPEIVSNDFFVSGESYGGKYSIAVAHTIHKKNPTAHLKINLKGISSGNGVVDPEHEVNYGEYYYQLGLIDFNTKKVIEKLELRAADKIHKHEYKLGLSYMSEAVLSRHSIFAAASGFEGNLYNLLSWNHTVNNTSIERFVTRADIRVALHVGNRTFQDGSVVMEYLLDEMMVSLAPLMIELLSHYQVLVYSGQLDLIVPYPITLNYLRHLNFSSVGEYKTAKRSVWRIDGDIAGYVKKAGNLTEVMVRNAGHMAIHDQPSWLYCLFRQFFHNKPIV